ncbi:hypothetical protein CcaverHIS631_0202830 [Cutaneotrichosporon cavernicola]|nr:hypothetical protein CcaverHIS631_0202830 [Cutaneotrichosporon cavernicola]BEJ04466.1 hypothetical protein CcaverHIS641_0202830 [Cutaneotrichosporon cavernicola]
MSLNHYHAHGHAHPHAHEQFPAIGMHSAHTHGHGYGHGQASPPSSPYMHSDDNDYEPSAVHKMRSKRDSAKYMREKEYIHDRTLHEVVDTQRCVRCERNGWRCFIEVDLESPRRVCRPCGKNKCSFGNSATRPATKTPRWTDENKPKAHRFEPYSHSHVQPRARVTETLPGVAALTSWARPLTPPVRPLTPPTEASPSREGSLELLAEAAHHANRELTPFPTQPTNSSYGLSTSSDPYREPAFPFTERDLRDEGHYLDLTMQYARYVPVANRFDTVANLFQWVSTLRSHY